MLPIYEQGCWERFVVGAHRSGIDHVLYIYTRVYMKKGIKFHQQYIKGQFLWITKIQNQILRLQHLVGWTHGGAMS